MSEFACFNSLISTTVLLMQYIVEICYCKCMYIFKLTEFFLLKITGIACMNTVLLTILHSKTCIFIENDFDVSLFYSISYSPIN